MNDKPFETDVTEECLLRAEVEDARAAVQRALLGMRDSLIATGDPKVWARTHPWISVGIAAAAGFAAASAIVPAPGQRTADKWAGVMHRLAPDRQGGASGMPNSPSEASAPSSTTSIWTSVIDALFELTKVAITNLLASMAQAKVATAAAHDIADDSSPPATAATNGAPPQQVG